MIWACQSASACTGGLYNEVGYTYDGEAHRTQVRKYAAGNATPTETWDFRYQGDAIVDERLNGVVQRTFLVDESGAIVKMTIPSGPTAGTYLVTWNGHGDALGLWRIEASGALTLANSYAYTTWGTPTTTTHNGIADLGFRFLYAGQHDVQWDNMYGLGLAYMHARHYAPTLGRFLQPDPTGGWEHRFAYARSNPSTRIDPTGLRSVTGPHGSSGIEVWDNGVGRAGISAWVYVSWPGPMVLLHWLIRWRNQMTGRTGLIDGWSYPFSRRWFIARNVMTGPGFVSATLSGKAWAIWWGLPIPGVILNPADEAWVY